MNENELSYKVITLCLEIHSELGPGLLENVYKQCLYYKLTKAELCVEMEKPMPVVLEGIKLESGYRIDLLVEKRLVIEIKSIDAISPIHIAQTLTYLRLGNFKLGLLLNFNVLHFKDGIKRIVNNL